MLIVVSGLPAVGKSATVKELSKKYSASILDSEAIRKTYLKKKEFYGPATQMYSDSDRAFSYMMMFKAAKRLIDSGKNVVIEGTFFKKSLRDNAKKLAEDSNVKFYFIEVICPEEIIKKRLEKRKKLKRNKGVVDFEMFKQIAKNFEPITEERIVINTNVDVWKQLDKLKIIK